MSNYSYFWFALLYEDPDLQQPSSAEVLGHQKDPRTPDWQDHMLRKRDRYVQLRWVDLDPVLAAIVALNRSASAYQTEYMDSYPCRVAWTVINGTVRRGIIVKSKR